MMRCRNYLILLLTVTIALSSSNCSWGVDEFVKSLKNLGNAIARSIQTTSVEHVLKLGMSIEQYIMNYNTVGSPKTSSLQELQEILERTDINLNKNIYKDGWGQDLAYFHEENQGSKEYLIISYGSDGEPGPEPAFRGVVRKFSEDIIWVNGRFVQRPEGKERMYIRLQNRRTDPVGYKSLPLKAVLSRTEEGHCCTARHQN